MIPLMITMQIVPSLDALIESEFKNFVDLFDQLYYAPLSVRYFDSLHSIALRLVKERGNKQGHRKKHQFIYGTTYGVNSITIAYESGRIPHSRRSADKLALKIVEGGQNTIPRGNTRILVLERVTGYLSGKEIWYNDSASRISRGINVWNLYINYFFKIEPYSVHIVDNNGIRSDHTF